MVGQKRIAVGNNKLMRDEKAELSDTLLQEVAQEQSQGRTVSYISVDGSMEGYLVIADAIKPGSKTAIRELMNAGVDVIMLTGDNELTAKAVAAELGMKHFKVQYLPEDKLNEIRHLQSEGKLVAMAGDGSMMHRPWLSQTSGSLWEPVRM